MAKKFSRSNVADSMLQLTQPLRSSFNMGHTDTLNLRMGRFTPVCYETIMPSDTWQGSALPKQYLEKLGTQMMGRLRLDTHHFFVSRQRINRDFRLDYAGLAHSNVSIQPTTNVYSIAVTIIAALGINVDSIVSTVYPLPVNLLRDCYNAIDILSRDSNHEYGFNRDFFALWADRIRKRLDSQTYTTSYIEELFFVLEPFCGLGSILDYFGYPVYSSSNNNVYHLLSLSERRLIQSTYPIDQLSISQILKIKGFDHGSGLSYHDWTYFNVAEEPLRAAYACWFDHMRDWMLEPNNGEIPNPDSFGRSDIFDDGDMGDNVWWSNHICLLIPRWRYFSDDMISTVQPDDVYRHVYSPVVGDPSFLGGLVGVSSSDSSGVAIPDSLSRAVDVILGTTADSSVRVPFLSDFLHHQIADDLVITFRQDLLTMRRAGWLEKWLMRNAKHPDTFSGQIRARFGVDPVNASVLEAIYLGGDETLMSTDPNIANVTTADTPAGQRTLTGGGSMSDSFSYQTTEFGYFITFCSLVPLPMYDAANTHLRDLSYIDLPAPEFATDSRVVITGGDLIRNVSREVNYGYVPRYYHWRLRPDAVHDKFLSDYRGYTFLRDSRTMSGYFPFDPDQFSEPGLTLNPYFARIHNMNECFIGIHELDSVTFGTIEIVNNMNRALPAAIEIA